MDWMMAEPADERNASTVVVRGDGSLLSLLLATWRVPLPAVAADEADEADEGSTATEVRDCHWS